MSSRIIPLTALSVVLVAIFWAVVATAQQPNYQPAGQPVGQPGLQPITQPAAQPVGQPQYDQGQYAQPGQPQPGQQPASQLQPISQQQPLAGPPAGAAPGQEPAPQPLANAPFVLTPQQAAELDQVLNDWQRKSGEVKTLEATFTRWDYDPVFHDPTKPKKVVTGKLKYAAPDKGLYELDDGSEKWICTGDAIFEFKTDLREMREHPLPPAMRGKAIADGPMPFVFGVEAAKMKARYWIRIVTPQSELGKQVWLEVYPRHANDAANFQKIEVILTFAFDGQQVTKLEPHALNMYKPNGQQRDVYLFTSLSVNSRIAQIVDFLGGFVRPKAPLGWAHKVMDTPDAPEGRQPAGPPQPGVVQPGTAGQPQPFGNPTTNAQPGIDVGQNPTGIAR